MSAISDVADDGAPAVPRLQFMKQQAALKRLPELLRRVRELERQLAALQS